MVIPADYEAIEEVGQINADRDLVLGVVFV